jgi:hypothetical protein
MTDKALPTWERPHLQPGGGDAHLYYKVHGHFDGGLKVSRSQHRCSGVPDGLTLKLYRAEKHPEVLAFGAVVPDGQVIRMAGLPEWTCRTLGNLDDPDFNNRRIEIGP